MVMETTFLRDKQRNMSFSGSPRRKLRFVYQHYDIVVVSEDVASACRMVQLDHRGRDGLVVRLFASHLVEPGSIPGGVAPGFSRVGIVSNNATARQDFSGIFHFLGHFITALLRTHLDSPSSALKNSMVIEVSMEQRWNKRAEETEDPRENTQTSGIIWHNSHVGKSGMTLCAGGSGCLVLAGHPPERRTRYTTEAQIERRLPPLVSCWMYNATTSSFRQSDTASQSNQPMRMNESEYGAAAECIGGVSRISPRKPAIQRHRPALFPRVKTRERPSWESSPPLIDASLVV
ncbi:hypothetical protein PR048_012511 [Dryococelus australis]|uniref:Uncharacterized protein n=1 Tax=Dryococelus australis TaxID=614101 RepID=A0ABQ9HQ76_9NEOP|nr:hypothetical protein PR048_012511 [Dryococelus australis]